MSTVNTVIIGAGHNGLTTGIVPAKAGLNVLVLSHAVRLGGLVTGVPNYNTGRKILNDWGSIG